MREKLTKKNEQTGFTIIEVVLVLAIAGLIFLIVFLALPQLQRSRRDTQRKNDAGRLLSAAENFAGNNNGDYPASAADFDGYIGGTTDDFADPEHGDYTITRVTAVPSSDPGAGVMVYVEGEGCDGDTGSRLISAVVDQESGPFYCTDNK